MIWSSSMIIVQVDNNIEWSKAPSNGSFKLAHSDSNDYKYYGLHFFDDQKTEGELHWSESFLYGKMNCIRFKRKKDAFILFSSTINNFRVLELVLNNIFGMEVKCQILKTNLNKLTNVDNTNLEVISTDTFCNTILLDIMSSRIITKMYINGLVTFNMTNDDEIINEIIDICYLMRD